MTRKTPWTPTNGYVLDDIKHITKHRLCPGMAVAAAEAKDDEEELIVQNFDHDGEESDNKLRAKKRKER